MVVADLHIHLWPGMDPGGIVRSALEGFARVAGDSREGVLGLTLTERECIQNLDTYMAENSEWDRVGGFRSRWSRRRDGYILDLLPGVQVVADEGLEVHGFFPGGERPERRTGPMVDLCREWVEAGGLVVLPFGVGKWRGRRREVLREVIAAVPGVGLGDNGNRLRGFGIRAIASGLGYSGPLWSGSDPLPIPGQEGRVGSTGVILDRVALENRSSQAILRDAVVAGDDDGIRSYGNGTGICFFLLRQIRMQIRKRLG